MKMVVAHLDRIEKKVDKLDERLDSAEKVAIKQEINLAEHMKRSDLLEKKLEPVENHVKYMNGALKGLAIVSLIVGVVAGILKLLGR